jgi:hypothetical protein
MATPTTLPATFVAGDVLTAAQMNGVRGAFRVLQVVNGVYGFGPGTTVSTSTYTATDLQATITPSSATSKILVMVSQGNRKSNADAATEVQSRLYRNGTNISTDLTLDTCYTNSAMELRTMATLNYLDSPATTSAVTYRMYGAASSGTASFNFFCSSQITLMEISA